jgi:hypothetical protein
MSPLSLVLPDQGINLPGGDTAGTDEGKHRSGPVSHAFQKVYDGRAEYTRMEYFKVTTALFVICILLLTMPVVSAATAEAASSASLTGLSVVPNILQEKSKSQYKVEDWKKEAEVAQSAGQYIVAIKALDKAEEIATANQPIAKIGENEGPYYQTMGDLESQKAAIYSNWTGHAAEADKANTNADRYYRTPTSGKDSPLPVWVPVSAVLGVLLLVRHYRR